ncbi:MAG: HAMP domain-containing sensor histidine kinase [Candidatus Paceibacterota bacterium]
MKRSYSFLFVIFLALSLVFLTGINFFKDTRLALLDESVILFLSLILIIVIILLFIYREIENTKARDQFITIITHKFRTPLTGIRWTINMLQKDITLLEKKDLLMEMEKANERLMEIVDLLVGFAKFDRRLEYAFEAVSLREIVTTSMNKYSAMIRDKNIKFSVDSDRELPLVIIDKAKIQFVVDMLIDNALKYTPREGQINALFGVSEKYITLKIKDNGIGFGFFDGRKIFKHFYRSKSARLADTEGLGLGLYTARNITKHHGGKLWAESPGPNKGSTFCLQLPIKR